MQKVASPQVQIVLAAHNVADSIGDVIKEWHRTVSPKVKFSFIVCEDGSKDGTKDILRKLAKRYPMTLSMREKKSGYSSAMIRGTRSARAPFVLCVDSDGQLDPKDFWKFWRQKDKSDIVIGWRVKRNDSFLRRLYSGSFRIFYKLLFPVRVHDPSCSYILFRRRILARFPKTLGTLNEGFWWEFIARATMAKLKIKEVKINHRARLHGETTYFKLQKMPKIAAYNLFWLTRIRLEY